MIIHVHFLTCLLASRQIWATTPTRATTRSPSRGGARVSRLHPVQLYSLIASGPLRSCAFVHVGLSSLPPLWESWTCARSAGTLLYFVYLCLPPPHTLESKEGFSCLERYLMDIFAAVEGEPLISFTDTFPCETTSKASVHAPQPKVLSCPSSSAQARPGG